MTRALLLFFASLIRTFLSGIRVLIRSVSLLLIVALLALNLSLVAIPGVYNALSGMLWSVVALVSDGYATRNMTQATTRSTMDANARRTADLELERNRLRTERAGLNTRLQYVDAEIRVVRGREAAALQAAGDLSAENSRLVSRAATAERSLQTESTRLRAERAQLDSRFRAVQAELGDLRQRELVATRAENSLRAQNAELSRRASAAEASFERAAAHNVRIQREARETMVRMQRRSVHRVARNTGTVFTDALPILGMATIVGGLAWDVWDSCDQLDDLRTLEALFGLEVGEEAEIEQRWCGQSSDEVFAIIFRGRSGPEQACIQARLRTNTLNPLECAAFPHESNEFLDFVNEIDETAPALPEMEYN